MKISISVMNGQLIHFAHKSGMSVEEYAKKMIKEQSGLDITDWSTLKSSFKNSVAYYEIYF